MLNQTLPLGAQFQCVGIPLPPATLDEQLLKYSVASTKSYLESVLDAIPNGAAILLATPPPLPVILMVPFTVKLPVQYIIKPLHGRNGLNNTPLLMVKL